MIIKSLFLAEIKNSKGVEIIHNPNKTMHQVNW
jgi:hypothetical protein